MSENPLANLAKLGSLKVEAPSRDEYLGLITSAKRRLADARNENLSDESRFDLAYNAAHAYALAALRRKGYRSPNRTIVFQALVHTTELDAFIGRVLSKCHVQRNLAEYEGDGEVDPKLLAELIECANTLETAVAKLKAPD